MRLVNALLNSSLTQLKELWLFGNFAWFSDDDARDCLIDFIKRQTGL